jgi:hopanoid biosynthesis associated RND transporter like protein HpnN
MAERMPHGEDESIWSRMMTATVRFTLRFPVATVVLAVVSALVAGWYSIENLGYRTNRHDLVNPKNEYGRLWNDYISEFGDEDDAVVVVEGENRSAVVPVLQELATSLSGENKHFHAVLHGVNLEKIRSKGLHYLDTAELYGVEKFLDEAGSVVNGEWVRLSLGTILQGMALRTQHEQAAAAADPRSQGGATGGAPGATPAAAAANPAGTSAGGADRDGSTRDGASEVASMLAVPPQRQLARLGESLLAAVGSRRGYVSPWPEMPASFATLSELNSEYLLMQEGKLGFVLLRLAHGNGDGFARGAQSIEALRAVLAQAQLKHPEVKIGLTGIPIMEHDEMASSQSSMAWASILSLAGVAALFIAGFGGMRHAMLANLVLLLGMAWTFGYAAFAVGHLNILSVSFAATLIGIGIDYGIHFVARYLKLRKTIRNPQDALVQSMSAVGPAIMTGAVTTAISFFMAGMTNFTGVAELGIIAGGGILLCAVAELFVLPAVIQLVDRGGGFRMPEPLPVHTWLEPLLVRPGRLLAATCLFTGIIGAGAIKLRYDHNLLNLQADGLESVALERKLLSECSQSMWYAVSMADTREELLERKANLLKMPSIERIEEIVSLLPADHEAKRPVIARIQNKLADLPERPPLIPVDGPEDLGRTLGFAQTVLAQCGDVTGARTMERIRDALRRLPAPDCQALLSQFQQQMAGDLLSRLHMLRTMTNPEPPQLSDLPESLVHRFVGHNNRHLLKIYGRGNIWDMDALTAFVHDVRAVDPKATGNPLQAFEASHEMKRSYEISAMLALVVILAVLWFNFRSVRYALLAAMPLGLGVLQTFGVLGILDLPLNPANMIALPLMLGLGVDYGIHIVHDFREQQGPYKMSPSTAVAVLVDSLTTIVGFGALMIADHQGLQSLGRVLTIGVSCCLFTSLVMLPALLTWWTKGRIEATLKLEDASATNGNSEPLLRGPHRRDDGPHPGEQIPHEKQTAHDAGYDLDAYTPPSYVTRRR